MGAEGTWPHTEDKRRTQAVGGKHVTEDDRLIEAPILGVKPEARAGEGRDEMRLTLERLAFREIFADKALPLSHPG
jgi:hypothetical protein